MARRVAEPETGATLMALHRRSQRLRIGHVDIAKPETVVKLMMAFAAKREAVVKATHGLLQSARLSHNSRPGVAEPKTVVQFTLNCSA